MLMMPTHMMITTRRHTLMLMVTMPMMRTTTAHDDHEHHGLAPGQKPHESPLVVTLPLILLAIPSVIIGFFAIAPMLYGDFFKGVLFFGEITRPWKSWRMNSTVRLPWSRIR